MATVVDALIMTLGLDSAIFEKGSKAAEADQKKLREDANKTAKEMEESGKRAAEFFSKVRDQALEMAAVFLGGMGIKEFASSTVDALSKLSYMGDDLGVSARDILAIGRAARDTGGSMEDMTAKYKDLAILAGKAANGVYDAKMQPFFDFGITEEDMKKGPAHMVEMVTTVIQRARDEALKRGESSTSANRAALEVASRMGYANQFGLVGHGVEHLREVLANEQKFLPTEEQLKKAQEVDEQLNHLGDRFKQVGVNMLEVFLPAFERVMTFLEKLGTYLLNHKDDIADWVDSCVPKILEFAKTVDRGAESVGGWKVVLGALLALKVASMASGLMTLAAALLNVGSALGVLGGASAGSGALSALVNLLAPLKAFVALLGSAYAMGVGLQALAKKFAPKQETALERNLEAAHDREIVSQGWYLKDDAHGKPSRVSYTAEEIAAAKARLSKMEEKWKATDSGVKPSPAVAEPSAIDKLIKALKEIVIPAAGSNEKPPPPTPVEEVAAGKSVIKKLKALGLSSSNAASIAGVIQGESGFNPSATNAKSGMYGLGQWDTARRAQFEKQMGKSIYGSSVDEQLKFLVWELRNTEKVTGDKLAATTDVKKGAHIFNQGFERPGVDIQEERKATYADRLYNATKAEVAEPPTEDTKDKVKQDNAKKLHQEYQKENGAAQSAVPGQASSMPNKNASVAQNTTTVETNINGPINIQTQSKDADEMASNAKVSFSKHPMVPQVNTGIVG